MNRAEQAKREYLLTPQRLALAWSCLGQAFSLRSGCGRILRRFNEAEHLGRFNNGDNARKFSVHVVSDANDPRLPVMMQQIIQNADDLDGRDVWQWLHESRLSRKCR